MKSILSIIILICLATAISSQNFLGKKSQQPTEETNTLINGEALKTFLNSKSKSELVSIALACERYARIKQGKENMKGGLHDYIRTLEASEITGTIIGFAVQFPELQNSELLAKISSGNLLSSSQLQEQLNQKSQEELAQIAINCEEYQRSKTDSMLIGGLHDYAFSLNKEKLVSIILQFTAQFPELSVEGALELKSKTLYGAKIGGGVHDFIWRYSKEELATMAMACQNYPNKNQYFPFIGGVDKYIALLSKEDVMKMVTKCTEDHPELQSAVKLEELKTNYLNDLEMQALRIKALEIENERTQNKRPVLGGLHDYINRMTKDELVEYIRNSYEQKDNLSTLRNYALALESEINKNKPVLGGLHDYINNMSEQEICDYITKNSNVHQFKVSGMNQEEELSALRVYALNLEKTRNPEPVLGGIHDYINDMTKEELLNYINKNL